MLIHNNPKIAWLGIAGMLGHTIGVTSVAASGNHWSQWLLVLTVVPMAIGVLKMIQSSVTILSESGLYFKGAFLPLGEFEIVDGKVCVQDATKQNASLSRGRIPFSVEEMARFWPGKTLKETGQRQEI